MKILVRAPHAIWEVDTMQEVSCLHTSTDGSSVHIVVSCSDNKYLWFSFCISKQLVLDTSESNASSI